MILGHWILLVCGLLMNVLAQIGDDTPTEEVPTISIIDILSSRAEFSYFLRHVQRAGLVPRMNSLRNVTIFVPVNLAFAGAGDDLSLDTYESLQRYFINLPLRVANLGRSQAIFETLYCLLPGSNYTLAIVPDFNLKEYVIDDVSTVIDSDIFAKHQLSFIQPIDHLLPIKPTLCQWLQSDSVSYRHPNVSWTLQLIELVIKTRNSKPPIGKRLSCSEFMGKSRSLFIPTDAFVELTMLSLESTYYTSLYQYMNSTTFDTTRSALNEFHADVLALVSGLREPLLVFGLNGTSEKLKARYSVEPETNNLIINHNLYVNQSISFADGVIHLLGDQEHADPFGALGSPVIKMNPRKALSALHYTNFVSEIQFRKLEYLIDGSTSNQTIFVEVEERDDKSDDDGRILAFGNRQSLLYHFADTALSHLDSKIDSGHQLVESKLCSKRRLGGCYPLKLSQSSCDGHSVTTINDDGKLESGMVYGGHQTYIYFTGTELATPSSFKHALGDLISSGGVPRHVENIVIDQDSCLLTIKLLNEFDLLSLDNNGKGYTAFLPCGVGPKFAGIDNWNSLGLVLKYLKQNPRAFKKVLRLLIVEGTLYSNYGVHDPPQSTNLKNLDGDWIKIQHDRLSLDEQNLLRLNDTIISVPLNSDVLFAQGVIHVVDQVLLFDNLEITFLDLMQTTVDKKNAGKSLLSIIGSMPLFKDRLGLGQVNSTLDLSLLVPTTESLMDQNITTTFNKLNDFFDFHSLNNLEAARLTRCINGPLLSGFVNTSTVITTNLRNESLTCIHDSHSKKTWLQLVMPQHLSDRAWGLSLYNKDHVIEVLSYGCARGPHSKNGYPQCVFLIKKPLNLAWLDHSLGRDFLHINLGFLSIGVGIIFGLVVVGFLVASVVYCSLRRERNLSRDIPKRLPVFEPRQGSNFMSVRLEEDEGYMVDHGYETDIEGTRHEWDALLAGYTPRKNTRQYGYGAVKSNRRALASERSEYSTGGPSPTIKIDRPVEDTVTSPRYIDGANLTKGLARDRNLPGF